MEGGARAGHGQETQVLVIVGGAAVPVRVGSRDTHGRADDTLDDIVNISKVALMLAVIEYTDWLTSTIRGSDEERVCGARS